MSHFCVRERYGPGSWAALEGQKENLLADLSPAMIVRTSELAEMPVKYQDIYVLTRRPREDPRPVRAGFAGLKQADTLFVPNDKGFTLSVWDGS